jgi:hypothetical protein
MGQTNPFQGLDPEKIAKSENEIKKLEVALKGVRKKADELEDGFGGITSAISASLQEMSKTDSAANQVLKSFRGIKGITNSLADDQAGLTRLSLKELKTQESKLDSLSKTTRLKSQEIKDKYTGFNLDEKGNELAGKDLDAKLKKLNINCIKTLKRGSYIDRRVRETRQ